MKNKTKVQKKRETVTVDLDEDLKEWLRVEKEAAEKQLGGVVVIPRARLAKGKLRARMADEKKGS